jgi:two-component system phosphate regulon sensor histidine kinase PhoR
MIKKIRQQFNIFGHCKELDVELWSCPRFVFVVMGLVIIASILTTYVIAQRYAEPDIVIMLVSFLTIFLLVITQVIVNAFEKVIFSRIREATQTKEVLELRDQFVHFAVHDLSSAATAIKWGLRTIEPKTVRFSAIEKEVWSSIRDRNERLLELARQILLVTKIESGHLEFQQKNIEPGEFIAKAISDTARAAKERGIALTYTTPQHPLSIKSDPIHLTEILRILLINSINHTDPKHGTITITLSPQDNSTIMITFENNGEMISEGTRKHVFEKLWRKEGMDNKEIAGTNFGLYIVKSLVLALHGNIDFTTEPQKTIFTLTLPVD